MKMKNTLDERVITQKRKINSDAYGILIMMLLASILVQQFLLNAPLEQYAAELICFLGISIYIIVRYMMLGINLYGEGKQDKGIPLVHSLVTGTIATAINVVWNYTRYAEHYKDGIGFLIAALVIFFISVTTSVYAVLSFLGYLNKKKQAKIQRQLDEDEQED